MPALLGSETELSASVVETTVVFAVEVELSSLSPQPVKIDAAIAREAATQSHFLKFIQSLSFSVTTTAPTTTTTYAKKSAGIDVTWDDIVNK